MAELSIQTKKLSPQVGSQETSSMDDGTDSIESRPFRFSFGVPVMDSGVSDVNGKSEMTGKKKGRRSLPLRVLLTNEILCILIPCMMPQDAVEFLACHPEASFKSTGWAIMKHLLKLDVIKNNGEMMGDGLVEYANDRDLMLHVIRKYGLCCSDCFTLLNGPNGFFCCTSLCKQCSTNRFAGCTYVDSIVRFYLCGSDNITVKGKAFLVHPFWYGENDESAAILQRHGNALRLAELIYKEKMFFAAHAPELDRPRDDKSSSLHYMLHREVVEMRKESTKLTNCTQDSNEEDADVAPTTTAINTATSYGNSPLDMSRTEHSLQDSLKQCSTVTPPTEAENSDIQVLSDEECECLLGRIKGSWGAQLPDSLQHIFDTSMVDLKAGCGKHVRIPNSQALGTMPLRDLVKNLHGKSKGSTKVMV